MLLSHLDFQYCKFCLYLYPTFKFVYFLDI